MPGARVGVLSDTHGNLGYLERTLDFLAGFEIDAVCHLGDDYEDGDLIQERGMTLHRVPGTYSPLYRDNLVPRKLQVEFAGRKLTLVHSPGDLTEADYSRADVLLYGHTHRFEIRRVERTLILNPGHLKTASHKGREASFGLLEMDDERVRATIYSLRGLASLARLDLRA